MRVEHATEISDSLLDTLRRLALELAPESRPLTRERLDAIVGSETCRLFVAYGDGAEAVGVSLLVSYPLLTAQRFWIEDVVVAPHARRHGVGEALVRAAVDAARDAGADRVDLTSRPAREAAHRLYERLGFVRRETNVYRLELNAPANAHSETRSPAC